jgi:hypothetical protein
MECWTCGLGRWEILLCRWATTPPRKQKVWWWRQFSEGNIVSLSTCLDQAYCFLIYMYFCLLLVRESGRRCWSSQHRNPAEISTQQSECFSCYDGCVHNVWRLKWQVIPKAPFALCRGSLFWPSSRCPVSAHPAVELLGLWCFSGTGGMSYYSAAVDWVLVLFLNIYLACWSWLVLSWDYHRISCVCSYRSVPWTRSSVSADCTSFVYVLFIPNFQIDGWYLIAITWIYYMKNHLIHACGILFGLNRIVCVTMI